MEIRHSFNKIAKSLLKCLEKIVHFFELFWLNCTFQPWTFQCLLRYPRDQGSPIWAIPVLWMRPCSVYRLSLRCCHVGCSSQECAVVHAQPDGWVDPPTGYILWTVRKAKRDRLLSSSDLRWSPVVDRWVCLKIGYTPNYSHLIGIMIINHWNIFRQTQIFTQAHAWDAEVLPALSACLFVGRPNGPDELMKANSITMDKRSKGG